MLAAFGVVAGVGAVAGGICSPLTSRLDKYFYYFSNQNELKNLSTEHPIHRYAAVPKILKTADGFVKAEKCDNVGYTLGKAFSENAEAKFAMQELLLEVYPNGNHRVPKCALAVSLAAENFAVGKSCHEFAPDPSKFGAPKDAFFTYQMIRDHTQIVYYNVNGTAHVAGVCFYFNRWGLQKYTPDEYVAQKIQIVRKYLLFGMVQNRGETYRRQCASAGKQVFVSLDENGVACHDVFNFKTKQGNKLKKCKECEEEHEKYHLEAEKIEAETAQGDVPVVAEA